MNDAGTIDIDGVTVPRLLYGTAWKEDATERLVTLALEQGFRGFDTANQRKHYYEAGTGAALAKAVKAGRVRREDLFIQTKFTFRRGQDHRLPYDADAPAATQVVQSFEKSLEHLQTDYIDSLVLHGPWTGERLHPIDWQVWRAMEAIHKQGRVRLLGVSNFKLEQVRLLCARAARDYGIVFTSHGPGKRKASNPEIPGGCYGGHGNVAIHWRNLARREQVELDSDKVTRFAKSLAPRSILRHHVVGDIGQA